MCAIEDAALARAKEKSDSLIMFLLKARRPQVYRERVSHEAKSPVVNGTERPCGLRCQCAEVGQITGMKSVIVWRDKPRHDGASRDADAFPVLPVCWRAMREEENRETLEAKVKRQHAELSKLVEETTRPKTLGLCSRRRRIRRLVSWLGTPVR